MNWLLHNYFLPTLNPSTAPSTKADPLRPLSPLLKQYKSLAKITVRDVSLQTEYKAAIDSTLREIERWLAEATVAASINTGLDLGSYQSSTVEPSLNENWALDRLCDELLERGILVPREKGNAYSHQTRSFLLSFQCKYGPLSSCSYRRTTLNSLSLL
jgi:ribosomal biogenesis protein LAS1